VLSIQPRTSTSGEKTREELIMDISKQLEAQTPKVFDLESIYERYPTDYKESMNTVLT